MALISPQVYEGIEQLMVVVAQTLTGDISVLDALSRYGLEKQRVELEHTVITNILVFSPQVYEGVEQLMVVVAQTLTGDISVLDALSRYGAEKQRVEMEHQDTDQMGRALLERLALPLVTTDG